LPTLETTLVPTDTPGAFAVQPVLRYDRVHVVGTDFSGTLGPVVVRGEAAYTFTEDPNGQDPAIGNPSLQAVLGAEYAIPSGARSSSSPGCRASMAAAPWSPAPRTPSPKG